MELRNQVKILENRHIGYNGKKANIASFLAYLS